MDASTHVYNVFQSLLIANKTTFHNCLVAMCPQSSGNDLPSTHEISTYIHNAFIRFIDNLKTQIQVSTSHCFFSF